MPDFGIGEALAAFGGTDILAGLFGGSEAAAAAAAPVAADVATTAAPTIADIVGTGTGLAGGATGLEGTLAAGGTGLGLADLAGGTAGLGAASTAADFMAAPGASGFNAAALTPEAFGGTTTSAALPAGVANAQAAIPSGTALPSWASTAGIPGAPMSTSAIPAAGGAAGLAGPAGAAPIDATSAAAVGGATPAAAGAVPAAAPSTIDQLLGKAGGSAIDAITKNPLGTALGAAGLGYNIYSGQKNTANIKDLTATAKTAQAESAQMVQSGEALQQYLTNGTLPPAYQTIVDNAIKDAKTNAISNAAQQGQNTDPKQNTALAATLAKIDASRATMQTQVATQLFSSGSSLLQSGQNAAGLSGQLFQALVQNDTTQAANTGKAIANLASAMSGKTSTNVGGLTISQG